MFSAFVFVSILYKFLANFIMKWLPKNTKDTQEEGNILSKKKIKFILSDLQKFILWDFIAKYNLTNKKVNC